LLAEFQADMLGTIISLTVLSAAALTTLGAVDWQKCHQHLKLLALLLFVLFLDNLILVFVNQQPGLQIVLNGSCGPILLLWSGKLYSVIASLFIAALINRTIPLKTLGLTLEQKRGSLLPGIVVMLLAALAAFWIGSGWDKLGFSLVCLIYMAVMPGLNEELVYRGLLLGILDHILPPRWNFLGAKIGWGACLTSLIFGLLHGFWVSPDLTFHFQWYPVLFSSASGFLFAWQKERTGSLLIPFLTHGMVDFCIGLARMI
jgi:uncharacterized protein